ncbi:hypothetical protein GA0070618_3956 [Micromonospora echinospora]|uniref:ABC-type branched-subunit amino acid transport system substrate-binding protein n=1 Tax=Micromonospora echinospora TaxID=1877 RepID=A0A1C4YGJ5_MICEC|nr:hypothetical protein [Micromonospora echinospora]SCF19766.1 hypothetical protein GA0070618_3956 [Micromonospora echinospora]
MRESTAQEQQPTPGRDPLPDGGLDFLALLARLLRRPRRGDRRLPVFWLVHPTGAADLMSVLRRLVGQSPHRRVPHAVVDVRTLPEGAGLPAVLRELHRQLCVEAFGAERIRFRHYPLADWLMQQSLTFGVEAEDGRSALVRRLRDRRGQGMTGEPLAPGGDAATVVSQVLFWLVRRAVPSVVFRIAVSGRLPVLGRPYSWFMRQQYLAPQQSVTFLGFAERLTTGWRDGEQPDQVDKLLLHAFLEDLRQAYRRRPWRPSEWRRTTSVVLLLDHVVPGDQGHRLVRLLNDVRNETGRNDPLLVLAVGAEPPPEPAVVTPLADAEEAYDEWVEGVPEARRLRRPAAWLLPLEVGVPDTGAQTRGAPRGFAAPDPPWWSRRFLPAGLCLVLLAAGGAWVGTRWGSGCLPSLSGQVKVELVGSECVGYSDSEAQVFNDDPGQDRLRAIQRRIFAQNRAAERAWERSGKRRPFLTLVYLGTLTGNPTREDEESYVSEREELEGMATARYALLQISAGAPGAALLRIVVANGGRQMRHAGPAVRMLAELAREDRTLLGVVGLVESRRNTAEAIGELNRVGLPVIAPNISGDGIGSRSRLYIQVSAPNTEQARLFHEYARARRLTDAHVYYTTGEGSSLAEDIYVSTLVADLEQRFGDRLARPVQWQPGTSMARECGYAGMLVFAGRWSEFDGFLRALQRDCANNPPRNLVGNDSVNRYMANPQLRRSAPGNLPVTYVSKASLATCAVLRAAASSGRDEPRATFLRWISSDDLLDRPRCTPGGDQVGERVSLAYDATTMVVRAVESLATRLHHGDDSPRWRPEAINPVGMHAEVLRQIDGDGYRGISGLLRVDVDTGVPAQKRLAMMRVERVPDVADEPVEVFHCGVADTWRPDPPCAASTPATR